MYTLTNDIKLIVRDADGAFIPNDPASTDWKAYEAWLAEGNVPNPYVPPIVQPVPPSPQATVLYDHENRIRTQEGLPPLSLIDFIAKTGVS